MIFSEEGENFGSPKGGVGGGILAHTGRGEVPEDTSNIVANVARVSEGAEQTAERHISQLPKFREKVGLVGRKRPWGSRCVTTPLTTPP